jgi:hypothetical protein
VNAIDLVLIMKVVNRMDPVEEFKEIRDSFKAEFKNWVQKSINLQHKYESLAQWSQSFSEVNVRFGEELVKI